MPISPITISDLQKTTAHFNFLLTAPYVKIETIPPNARFCAICQEPFDNNVWQLGTTVNRPVKLECGHKFGIKCLAHLVFASDFRNRCPVCRAQLMPDSFDRNSSGQSWKVVVLLLRTLMMFGGDGVAFDKKKALEVLQDELAKKGLMRQVPGKHMLRIMVLYVEFLGQFCSGVQPMGDAERARAAERREQGLLDYIERSLEVRRREDELRVLRAQQEEVVRDEREEELRELKRELRGVRRRLRESRKELQVARNNEGVAAVELEAAREALKDAAGGFTDAQLGSALTMLGATFAGGLVCLEGHPLETSITARTVLCLWLTKGVVALIRSLPSKRSRIFISSVMFCMALGWVLYRERKAS